SGKAVAPAIRAFNIVLSENLFVIHDDMDIDFGNQKIKSGGRDAGHKGIRSIIAETGTSEFYRIKLGIGKPGQNCKPENYVLDKFLDEERTFIDNVWCSQWNNLVEKLLCDGIEKTMSIYNKRRQKE
ncbi:MAG TPA: peptidyl-tRNA hydrolase, partial [bacterium]|nr:peptidyl-tRNA hydrolase [bacterium]